MTEPLHFHELRDVNRSGYTHLREVVARKINQHQVLGALFLIGQQFSSQGLIGFNSLTAGGREPAIGWVMTSSPVTVTRLRVMNQRSSTRGRPHPAG